MLENYEIINYDDIMLITCKKCFSYHIASTITDNIIDIYNSRQMVEQFLLLNNFTKIFKCTFNNKKLGINIDIGINYYIVHDGDYIIYDDVYMEFKNSHELLEYLKERLNIESMNKLVQIE